MWSTGNYARSFNLIIQINGLCTTQNPSWRTWRTKFYGILTDYWVSTRPPDLLMVNKKKKKKKKSEPTEIVNSAVPANHRVKLKESENRDKHVDLARELKKKKKKWNMKVTVITIVIGALSSVIKERVQGLEELEIRGAHPNYSIEYREEWRKRKGRSKTI